MRVVYDARTDTLSIILNDRPISESDEEKPGVILDYDQEGNLVSMEILDASTRVQEPTQMVYELAGAASSGR
jgi:YD repeat-containing protein